MESTKRNDTITPASDELTRKSNANTHEPIAPQGTENTERKIESTSFGDDQGAQSSFATSSRVMTTRITPERDAGGTVHTCSSTETQPYRAYMLVPPACLQQYGGWMENNMGVDDIWVSDGEYGWLAQCIGTYDLPPSIGSTSNRITNYDGAQLPDLQ